MVPMGGTNVQAENIYLKTFVYGVFSVVTCGFIPSMLHRMGTSRVAEFMLQRPVGGCAGMLEDIFNVCKDISSAAPKVGKQV